MTRGALLRGGKSAVPPLALGVIGLAAWQGSVTIWDIEPFLLPSPMAIVEQAMVIYPVILSAGLSTGSTALWGFVAGALVAILLAVLSYRSRALGGMLVPLASIAAVAPIAVIAPMLYSMFGATSETPRRLIVAITVFAPVYINTLRGLKNSRPIHRDLLHSYNATGWQVSRTVTLPTAVPFMFVGLRLASALAVVAALIVEFFGGLTDGLGALIYTSASTSAYPRTWAYVAGVIVLGLVFYLVMLTFEKAATRRYRH